jgi:predicted DNA-binding transcriptional regulator YafY
MRVVLSVEIERWILGWGEQAVIISPVSLKAVVAERIEKARAGYTAKLNKAIVTRIGPEGG